MKTKKMLLIISILVLFLILAKTSYSSSDIKEFTSFDDVKIFDEKGMFVKKDGKWGQIDKTGKFIVNPIFDKIYSFSEGFIIGSIDNKYGILNEDSKWIVKPQYKKAPKYNEESNVFITQKNNEYGFIDIDGKVISEPKFSYIFSGNRDVLIYMKDNMFGLISTDGTIIKKPKFEKIYSCDINIFAVKIQGKWGLMDNEGNYLIETILENVKSESSFSEGLFPVKYAGKWGYVDINGEFIIQPTYLDAWFFSEGLAAVNYGGKWGYINKQNNFVIEPTYTLAKEFSDGFAVASVYYDDENKEGPHGEYYSGVINTKGDYVIKPIYDHVFIREEDILVDTFDKKFGIYDKNLKLWLEPKGLEMITFNLKEEVVKSRKFAHPPIQSSDDYISYMDLNGDVIIESKYKLDEISSYHEGFIAVKEDGKWGFKDNKGLMVIESKFDEVGYFFDGLATVKYGKKWYFINTKGEFMF